MDFLSTKILVLVTNDEPFDLFGVKGFSYEQKSINWRYQMD